MQRLCNSLSYSSTLFFLLAKAGGGHRITSCFSSGNDFREWSDIAFQLKDNIISAEFLYDFFTRTLGAELLINCGATVSKNITEEEWDKHRKDIKTITLPSKIQDFGDNDLSEVEIFVKIGECFIDNFLNIEIPLIERAEQDRLLVTLAKLEELESYISFYRSEARSSLNPIVFNKSVTESIESSSKTLRLESELDSLLGSNESINLEYKETFTQNKKTGKKDPALVRTIINSLAAFSNTEGGSLIVGIRDHDLEVVGIDNEIKSLFGKSEDRYLLAVQTLFPTSWVRVPYNIFFGKFIRIKIRSYYGSEQINGSLHT